jgi:hypothetical protein
LKCMTVGADGWVWSRWYQLERLVFSSQLECSLSRCWGPA